MTTELTMPQMGYDMQEGTILKWLKSEGDAVENGDPIAEIETDKAVVEFESYAAGVLSSILVSAGSTVPVGEPIAVIGAEAGAAAAPPPPIADAPDADAAQSDDDADDDAPAADAPDDAPQADALDADAGNDSADAPAAAIPMPAAGEYLTAQEPPAAAAPTPAPAAVPLRASPVARRIADEQGVDIAHVQGSGPGGRVTRDDVLAFVAASEQASEEQPAADLAAAQEQAADEAQADAPLDEADAEIGISDTEAPAATEDVPAAELDAEPESAAAPDEPPAADVEPVAVAEPDEEPVAMEEPADAETDVDPIAADEPEDAVAAEPEPVAEPMADEPIAVAEPDDEPEIVAEPAAEDEPEPVADDEPAATDEPIAADEPEDAAVLPLTRMRQQIARVTVRSKSEKPHFYVTSEVDMTDAMALRVRINAALADEGTRVTVNDMIIKACVDALQKHPKFNAFLDGDAIRLNDSVNVGVAMAVEDGLLMPAIMGCEGMSLKRLALASKDLADRAQNGALRPDEYTGGTFGVSNLGMFDVSTFVAIIQPPQSAILAVGTVAEKPVVRGGEIVVRQTMNATISADHRVVDGAEGARFLIEVKRSLENPLSLLL